MTVLVTGSNGFLGAALVERLLAQGKTDVRCFVRAASDTSRLERLRKRHPHGRFELTVGSLGSAESAAEVLAGIDTVYHLAAAHGGEPTKMRSSTVVGSQNLVEAVRLQNRDIKLVLVSSFGVYGVADLPAGAVIDERTPLETQPQRRDLYSQLKLEQETLFWDARRRWQLSLVVLRPGVIYGPGGGGMSARVGLRLPGVFLHLGNRNLLPLSYVDNCAEALVVAGTDTQAVGQVYNVHDDDLPTCAEFLQRYEQTVKPLRKLRVPYPLLQVGSHLVEWCHERSRGRVPAIITPYRVATTWKGHRFDNGKLKSLGWRQLVSTGEGMRRTFESLRQKRHESAAA